MLEYRIYYSFRCRRHVSKTKECRKSDILEMDRKASKVAPSGSRDRTNLWQFLVIFRRIYIPNNGDFIVHVETLRYYEELQFCREEELRKVGFTSGAHISDVEIIQIIVTHVLMLRRR